MRMEIQSAPKPRSSQSASAGPTPPFDRLLVHAVARGFRVREAAIMAPGRTGAREALARHAAMYLAHVGCGRSYAEIAALFGRHRTSVSYACARIEDRRDEPAFDDLMARLERRLATLLGRGA